jgi:hypothetical protein
LYIGSRLVRVEDAVADSNEFKKKAAKKNVEDDDVADHTIDIFDPPALWRGLLAALRFFEE